MQTIDEQTISLAESAASHLNMQPGESIRYRLEYIDLIKGVGIILVVLGHGPFPFHFAFDVFHMPLFFFLAGITFHEPSDPDRYVIGKCKRLVIPYVFYSLTFGVVSTLLHFTQGPLWFFETILIAVVLFMILQRKLCRWQLCATVIFLSFAGIVLTSNGYAGILPFNMCRAFVAMLFIYCGYIYRDFLLSEHGARIWIYTALAGLVLYTSGILLYKNAVTEGASFINGRIYTENFFLFYLTSIGGILLTVALCRAVGKISFVNWLGRNSLTIMAAHWPLIQVLNTLIGKTELFQTIWGKLILTVTELILIFAFCVVCSLCFRRYIPRLTGYKPI